MKDVRLMDGFAGQVLRAIYTNRFDSAKEGVSLSEVREAIAEEAYEMAAVMLMEHYKHLGRKYDEL